MAGARLKPELQNGFREKTCGSLVWPNNLVGCWVRVLSPRCCLSDLFTIQTSCEFPQSNLSSSPQSSATSRNALATNIHGLKLALRLHYPLDFDHCDKILDERQLIWRFFFLVPSPSWQEKSVNSVVCDCGHRSMFIIASQQAGSEDPGARNRWGYNSQALWP